MIADRLGNAFVTVEEVLAGLDWLETHWRGRGDLRGVFATAYLEITRALQVQLNRDTFHDYDWVCAYLVCFAEYYRKAVLAAEAGGGAMAPKSWRIAFDYAALGEGFILQHLLLGINAHINHDLSLTLRDVGIDPRREDKYRDHSKVNEILEAATEDLKRQVAIQYAPLLKRLDRMTGRLSNEAVHFSIPKARDHAWTFAVALARAGDGREGRLLERALDEQAAVLARLIIAGPTRNPRLRRTVGLMKRFDAFFSRIGRWWRR